MKTEYFVVFVEYHSIEDDPYPEIFVTQPMSYDQCLDKKHSALQSMFVKNARIAKLTWLD